MKTKKQGYIGYYRVSTSQQGVSGLGLESQKQSVRDYIKQRGNIVDEFVEIESGKNSSRPELLKAIEMCKITGATLIIAKLDRLSRNAKFILTLKESNVKFESVDMPDANSLTINIMAVLAQDEAERISGRTKKALDVIKKNIATNGFHITKAGKKITKLGSPKKMTDDIRQKGLAVRKEKARNNPNNIKAGAFIKALRETGMSFYMISKKLNESGFKTSRGKNFTTIQAQRLYEKYNQ